MRDSAAKMSRFKCNKKLILLSTAAASFLLFSAVARLSHDGGKPTSISHATVLRSACSSTLYPDLCVSAGSVVRSRELTSQKDVIEALLNFTTTAAKHSYFVVERVALTRSGVTSGRAETAVHDCLETIKSTLDDLHAAAECLRMYPKGKTLRRHADDLKTLISSAMTYQETCLDGFSHDHADKMVRKIFLDRLIHVERLCGIVLAMIKNMTDADIARSELKAREHIRSKPEEVVEAAAEVAGEWWPWWLSPKERWLLQSSEVTPDCVVAADGSGDFKTVLEAVEAAPKKSKKRYVVKIKAGVYKENLEVPSNKQNIMFMGDGRMKTIITGNWSVLGTPNMTTYRSATVAVKGKGFLARDITFENTAGPSNEQAVALRVDSDFSAFYRCGVSAYQDTLYVHSRRTFFVNCFVAGTIDFIFGNSAAVLQNCDIHARRPNSDQKNMVTAQGRTDPNQNTGIVIQNCRIDGTSDLLPELSKFPTYLGRPWKNFSRTVVMESYISEVIRPEGWYEWNGDENLDTLTYREYKNRGEGADTADRVKWKGFKVITDPKEAEQYTAGPFIDGDSWLPDTGFPFELGL